jgi:hypothetical protein
MKLKNRDIDKFQVLAVTATLPDAIPQFYPFTSCCSKTRVRDVFIDPVTVGDMICSRNEGTSDRIQ